MEIPFSTGRHGEGPLIWAQAAIWNVLRWLPPEDTSLNLLTQVTVPSGHTLDSVVAALRTLVERHDSLHTLYVDTADGPVQRVQAEGAVELQVHALDDVGADVAGAGIGEALRRPRFDMGTQLPIRAAVLLRAGAPQQILIAASHMAVDGGSLNIVRADLAAILGGGPLPEPGQQPLERGEYERSPVGRRREAKALAYWRRQLETLPDRMIERARDDEVPDLEWGLIQSPAMALAINSLAARHGVPSAAVLLGGVTLQLAAYLGEDEAALRLIVATRFRPASRGVVAAFNQNALFRLDCAPGRHGGEPVGELLRRSADAAFVGYAHSEYDPRALDAMFAELAGRRGVRPHGYCFFNDTRFGLLDAAPPAVRPAGATVEALLPQTKLRSPVIDRLPMHANFFMFLMDLGETAELMLSVERGFFGRRGPLGYLADLERLFVRAAGPGATTGALYAGHPA